MSRRTFRVSYVGSALAGATTSLTSALLRNGQALPVPANLLLTQENEFSLRREGSQIQVAISVGARRAHLAERARTGPAVEEEFRRISRAEGYIFVVNSEAGREAQNRNELALLRGDLARVGVDIDTRPVVFQANKRDLANVISMKWITEQLCTSLCAHVESVATEDRGTMEALRTLLRLLGAL
jgi:hypothetical protein